MEPVGERPTKTTKDTASAISSGCSPGGQYQEIMAAELKSYASLQHMNKAGYHLKSVEV